MFELEEVVTMSRVVACIHTYVASGTRYVCCVFMHKYFYIQYNKVRLRELVDSLCRDGTDMPIVGMGLQIYCQKMAKPSNFS